MSESMGMGGGASQAAPGASGASAPSQVAPSGSPASQPQPPQGQIARAGAMIGQAVKVLEQALTLVGSGSEQGSSILSALKGLNKTFPGQDSASTSPAQLVSLLSQRQGAPQAPAGPGGQGGG